MAHPVENISSIKLAWAVSWSAFWTGFPFKLIVALLLLAGQVHPWDGAGLVKLLVVSMAIDIWAVGMTAWSVFLEMLIMEIRVTGVALTGSTGSGQGDGNAGGLDVMEGC